ncbi:MAG: CocE/NonD family hydrolase [Pseudomonadota bacterium]
MTSTPQLTHFHDGPSGRLYVSLYPARSDACVLFVPPFAEELNKSRRQMALAGRVLAAQGLNAVVVDLSGTGDSAGEFADATWEAWVQDLASVCEWIDSKGLRLQGIVAIRLGCLLACAALRASDRKVSQTVFWQPVNSGYRHISSFLRIAVASSLMRSGPRVTVERLRERLARGESLEVAGYRLSPALTRTIDEQSLVKLADRKLGRVHILHVERARPNADARDETLIDDLAEQIGVSARVINLPGAPYWASSEVVVNSGLTEVTRQIFAA